MIIIILLLYYIEAQTETKEKQSRATVPCSSI